MESVKALIHGDGVDTSVEFSVEEVIAHHHGKPWGEMNDADRETEMKNYALSLFSRDSGLSGDLRVSLQGGSFSKVQDRDI